MNLLDMGKNERLSKGRGVMELARVAVASIAAEKRRF